jgi:hypothetical protein
MVRASGLAEREWVEVETRSKPKLVILDPRVQAHDWNMLNNRRRVGGFLAGLFGRGPKVERYLHPYFSTRSRRDRLTLGFHPTLWYNEAGGVTIGLRYLSDYLGRYEQNQSLINWSTGWGVDDDVKDGDFFFRQRNPVALQAPNLSQTLDVYNIEGRYGATARLDWSRRDHQTFGPTRSRSISLQWVATDDFRYLDRGYYDDVGTVELALGGGISTEAGEWDLSLRTSTAGGLAYNSRGLDASGRPELDPFYFRGQIEGIARWPLGSRLSAGARVFVGVATGEDDAAKQRQIYFQGADPLQQLTNPFLRSRGALLVGDDFNYHAPGGAGVRGIDPRVSTTAIVAFNLELEQTVLARPSARLLNRVGLAVFTDLSQDVGGSSQPLTGDRIRFLGDAGIGLRARHRIGETNFVTRFDFPFFVSRPELAQDRGAGDGEFEFRWTFSFGESF